MKKISESLPDILGQISSSDLTSIREFLFNDPTRPLICTGSGGAETAGDFAALLYGARYGVGDSISPLTFNSLSDNTLKSAKILLFSKGGHNNDIIFATKRALEVNPEHTMAINFYGGERNDSRKLFLKAGSSKCIVIPVKDLHDGFVSCGTPLAYFALLSKVFNPETDLSNYGTIPDNPFILSKNDGTPLSPEDFGNVGKFITLHGSWGRPVAYNLEGKMCESGLALSGVYDFRNYCHGRFIYTSNHLEDSAVIMFVSPREEDLSRRIRGFLPSDTKLVIIRTEHDSPEASLDLLIRSTLFFGEICEASGVDPDSPANHGRIDKRVPIWIPFKSELKKLGPLTLK
ncbi:MAG: hypothetical protein IJL91_00435 [Bacteroidales bacterium]|nr:hypothetical protein [Bacteroidales bacterium]